MLHVFNVEQRVVLSIGSVRRRVDIVEVQQEAHCQALNYFRGQDEEEQCEIQESRLCLLDFRANQRLQYGSVW